MKERVKEVGRREVREERERSSRRKSFGVHSLDSVLLKREVPGPSDVVCSEVADDRVTTQQLARGDQTEHDGSSSLYTMATGRFFPTMWHQYEVTASGSCSVHIPTEDIGQHTGIMMDVDQHGFPLERREIDTLHRT